MINSKNFQAGFIGSLPIESGALAYAEARNVPDTFISIFKTSPIISKIIKDFDLRDSKGNIIDFKDFTLSIFKTPILIFRQKKGVKIKQIGSSETLEIIGYSDNRDQAVNLTNAVANAFIDFLGNAYRQEATTARYILEEQLLDVYKRLRLAKNAEERYKIKNNATNITEFCKQRSFSRSTKCSKTKYYWQFSLRYFYECGHFIDCFNDSVLPFAARLYEYLCQSYSVCDGSPS